MTNNCVIIVRKVGIEVQSYNLSVTIPRTRAQKAGFPPSGPPMLSKFQKSSFAKERKLQATNTPILKQLNINNVKEP